MSEVTNIETERQAFEEYVRGTSGYKTCEKKGGNRFHSDRMVTEATGIFA